jgi:predicted small lipoprotein YifL
MGKKKTIFMLSVIMMVLGLVACGNKGDLYLPDEEDNKTEQTNPQDS